MTEFNWDELNGKATERMRKPKTSPVPDSIVRLAQRSVDSDPTLANCKELSFDFGTDKDRAEAFVKLMRKAGAHTKPEATIKVTIDPDGEGKDTVIAWYARRKPGRVAANSTPAPAPAEATAEDEKEPAPF